jgi:hypothetical protein
MAHFAKLNSANLVEKVVVVSNDVATNEQAGIDHLKSLYGSDTNWKQCSYNTSHNMHRLGGTPFRKNFPGIGHTYDETADAFIESDPPYVSWVFNSDKGIYEAPIPRPENAAVWIEEEYQNDTNDPKILGWF